MSRTSFFAVLLGTASLIVTASAQNAAAVNVNVTAATPHVGEVKALILNPQNASELGQLRQQGWVQATGQLVSIREYPALYRTIGRRWTSPRVSSDQFALPDLDPADEQREAQRNPDGVLGPGDLVTGGQQVSQNERPSLCYFIYVGQQ